jgi:hypothetical protein
MSDIIEGLGLHFEGFSDQQIAQIDGIKDDLMHLMATLKLEMPRLNRVIPVLTMAAEVIAQHQKEPH